MQTNYGFDGQIHACWTHKMIQKEIEIIRSAGFLVSVIHGRYMSNPKSVSEFDIHELLHAILLLFLYNQRNTCKRIHMK